jgi:hypothetical protein
MAKGDHSVHGELYWVWTVTAFRFKFVPKVEGTKALLRALDYMTAGVVWTVNRLTSISHSYIMFAICIQRHSHRYNENRALRLRKLAMPLTTPAVLCAVGLACAWQEGSIFVGAAKSLSTDGLQQLGFIEWWLAQAAKQKKRIMNVGSQKLYDQ